MTTMNATRNRMIANRLFCWHLFTAIASSFLSCSVAAQSAVDWKSGTHTIVIEGMERDFILDVPDDLQPGAPLVWVFHGYTGSAASMRESSGFAELFQHEGMVVVYPQGTRDSKGNTFFNVGYAFHDDQPVDDAMFVRTLTDRLVTELQLDPRAVFATGMSNGGDMSFFLAAQKDPVVRAIAPVAGTMMQAWSDDFVPSKRIPVMAVHGTDDKVTKWDGDLENRDGWGSYLSVDSVRKLWTQGMCLEQREVTKIASESPTAKRIELHRWFTIKDDAEVRLYKIEGGGHDWPENLGNPQHSTAKMILKFFRSHTPNSNE